MSASLCRAAGLCAIWLALLCAPAWAHKASDSYLTLAVEGRSIEGQWDIALRDLELALGLDADGDGAITWGELRARHPAVAAYALSRLRLSAGQSPCRVRVLEHLVDRHSDGGYAVLRLGGECERNGQDFAVDYRLLFDLDPQHRGLLRLDGGSHTRSAVFSNDAPVQSFALGETARGTQFASFFRDGATHIWLGFDHVLFLLALLLPAVLVRLARDWQPVAGFRPALWTTFTIVTAFTVAHSITLSLAALQVVSLPARLAESLIALSVLLAAADNLLPFLPDRRWQVAFVFGLVHGFGFASVLVGLGLPRGSLLLALAGFNLGVEAGQLAIVGLFLPLAYSLRARGLYSGLVLRGGSALIVLVALGWLVERVFDLKLLPA